MNYFQDMKGVSDIDVQAANPYQQYSVDQAPNPYVRQPMPEELNQSTGGAILDYGSKGAALGMKLGGPLGAGIGAGVGAIGGIFKGRANRRKREAWENRQEELYGRWAGAMSRFQDNQANQRMSMAKNREQSRRSTNTVPYFNQSIYGL
jgi:hypothetical protein